MRWFTANKGAYSPGVQGRILAFIDRSGSMMGEPTEVVNLTLPHVRRAFPGLHVIDFDHSSDIEPAIMSAVQMNPERSIIISDGYISGVHCADKISGKIDAVFCGQEKEMQVLPRRIQFPNYFEWPEYHNYIKSEDIAHGAYSLWQMTRGRGVINYFRWGQGPQALFDLIVHRKRVIRQQRLPDRHIYHGRGS